MPGASTSLSTKHVNITQCALFSPLLQNRPEVQKGLSDITPVVTRIVIYENMFSPVLTGELHLQDDTSLSSIVPLLGIEKLFLKFDVTDPVTGKVFYYGNSSPVTFSIHSEEERTPRNQGTETYKLGLISPELLTSTDKRISRAYHDVHVDDIVTDIMESPQFVNTAKKFVTKERTKTPVNLVIPYLTALDTIKLLTLQGQSSGSETNYVFFESLNGFHFASLQKIIADGQTGVIPKITRTLAGTTGTRQSLTALLADDIEIVTGFDFLYLLSQGYFSSVTYGLDILSGKYRRTVGSNDDPSFVNRMLVNGKGATPIYPASLGKIGNPSSKIFLVPTTAISAANTTMTALDSSIKDNQIEATLDGRNRELLALQTRCVRLTVAGAPNLHAGSLIDIDVPMPIHNNKLIRNSTDIASGRYLIVAAKHSLVNNGQGVFLYETSIEACSDSFK